MSSCACRSHAGSGDFWEERCNLHSLPGSPPAPAPRVARTPEFGDVGVLIVWVSFPGSNHSPFLGGRSTPKLPPRLLTRITRAHRLLPTGSMGSETGQKAKPGPGGPSAALARFAGFGGEKSCPPQGCEPGTAKSHHPRPQRAPTRCEQAKSRREKEMRMPPRDTWIKPHLMAPL